MEEKDLKRLSDCEVLINKYYQEIQNFIKHADNYAKDVLSKKEFYEYMHVNKAMFYKELDRLSFNQNDQKSQIQSHEKRVEDNTQLSNKMHDSLNSLSQDVMQLFAHVDFLKHKDNEFNQRMDSLNLRMPNREKIQQDHFELKKRFELLFEDLQKEVDALRSEISQQDADLRLLQGKISNEHDVSIKRQSDNDIILSQIKNQISEIKSIHKSDKEEILKYINNMPLPQMPSLPNFDRIAENIQKSVMDKVEEDSKKYLKALDISLLNDIQIKVLNKKLDSILAILEKNKLS